MEKRKLGSSSIDVSVICLGTMTFGQQNTEDEAHEIMDCAIEHGVNFLDAAELYPVPSNPKTQGLTETYVGTWLQKQSRESIILATKIAGPSPNLSYIRNPMGFSTQNIQSALEKSLNRLQTNYIDLYQLHWPERKTNRFGQREVSSITEDPWEENFTQVLSDMHSLVESGKIKTWGLSNESPWGFMKILMLCDKHGFHRPVSMQNAYSLLNRAYEIGLAEISLREQIGLLAYSPLAMGLLSGKYHKKLDKPADRFNQFKGFIERYQKGLSFEATAAYIEVAENYDLTPTQLALTFVNTREFLTSNIIGATDLNQLKENLSSAQLSLSQECLQAVESVHIKFPNPSP